MIALVVIVGLAFSLYYFSSVSEFVVDEADTVVVAMTEDVAVPTGRCSAKKTKSIEEYQNTIANNNESIRECQIAIGQQRIAIRNHNAKKCGYSDVRVADCQNEIAQYAIRIIDLIAENSKLSKKLGALCR